MYVLVVFHYKDDIITTQDRGRANIKCNNNDIIQLTGYN